MGFITPSSHLQFLVAYDPWKDIVRITTLQYFESLNWKGKCTLKVLMPEGHYYLLLIICIFYNLHVGTNGAEIS